MPVETLEFSAPMSVIDFVSHPNAILRFYCRWGKTFLNPAQLAATPPSSFFTPDATFVEADGSTVCGSAAVQSHLVHLHERFARIERESLRVVLLTDPEVKRHELQTVLALELHRSLEDEMPLRLAEAVYYEIVEVPAEGEDEEEVGGAVEGFQIKRMWNSYDKKMVDRTLAEMEEERRNGLRT